jgi:hypothetical protein
MAQLALQYSTHCATREARLTIEVRCVSWGWGEKCDINQDPED